KIDTNLLARWRQGNWIGHFAAKTGIPLTSTATDAHRLDVALDGAVPAYPQPSNAKDLQAASVKLDARPVLLETETVKVVIALEARITGGFACFHAAKEGLIGLVHIIAHHLHGLAEDGLRFRKDSAIVNACLFQVALRDAAPLHFPGQLAIFDT